MSGFDTDDNGSISVTYTINGEDSPPFSIGVFQSADGIQPGALVGTIDVSDPEDLSGGGTQHSVVYQGGLNGLAGGQFYLAQLDYNAQVEQTTRAYCTSAPLIGTYQDSDGALYTLFGADGDSHGLGFSQDTSGNVTMDVDGTATTFQDVSAIYVAAYQGSYNIDASGVSIPFTAVCGSGNDSVIGGEGKNEMYGGSGADVFDGSNGQNNWIQAGSGGATITGGNGNGNDWLFGGAGTNHITGGAGTEKNYGGSGTNYLEGGGGLDDIIGGSGTNYIIGHGAHDLLAGGSGQNSIFNDGVSTPQIVDSADNQTAFPSIPNYYQESGTWADDPTPGTAYSGGQRLHAAGGTSDSATWTFDNLGSSQYYEVYATWSPEADAATAAQYTVDDGGTPIQPIGETSTPTVNQSLAPADLQAAGVYWQDLGVFQPTTDTLSVTLARDPDSPVLANAVMIVPESTPPVTSLSMGSFTVDNQGNLSVSYTINGEDAPPFSIGIYGSPDGIQPTNLLQSYEVDDPSLLTGGGATHTVTFPASLDELDSCQYVIAELDSSDAVPEASRAGNISSALSGVFEQSDGALLLLGNSSSLTDDEISLTQDINGSVTVNVTDSSGDPISGQTFSGVTSATFSTPGGDNSVNVDPSVTVPAYAYVGPGSSVTGPVAATDATPSITIDGFPATIEKGGIATIEVSVGNLGGLGFTATVDWGLYEGSDTVVYPAGTTLFYLTHHYVDDGLDPFDTEFPLTIDVTPDDGKTTMATTTTLGVDMPLNVNIECPAEGIDAPGPVDATAVVSDPGEFGTFYYYWTATGGGETFTGTAACFSFTPHYQTSYTIALAVTNPDNDTFYASETIPGSPVSGGGGPGAIPFVPDNPTVTIAECDAGGTEDDSSIVPGSDAYFLVSVPVEPDDMPDKGTISVWYNTADGPALETSPIAHANTDYIASGGKELTFPWDSSAGGGDGGYDPQIISVQTVATSDGGTFSVDIPCFSDPFASTVGNTFGMLAATATASIETTDLQLMLYQYGQDAKNIKNNSAKPDFIPVGQKFQVAVLGASGSPTFAWDIPDFPSYLIGSFDAGTPGGPKPPVFGTDRSTCTAAWVQAGNYKMNVDVTIGGVETILTGHFSVQAPSNPVVTLTPFNGPPDNGIKPYGSGVAVEFGSNAFGTLAQQGGGGQDGVTWSVVRGIDLGKWSYGWGQILLDYHATRVGPPGNEQIPRQGGVLDESLPSAWNMDWGDSPGLSMLPGQQVYYEIVATTWIMLTAKKDGVWVPLAKVNWYWTVFASYTGPKPLIVYTSHEPTVVTDFTLTHVFPVWTQVENNTFFPF